MYDILPYSSQNILSDDTRTKYVRPPAAEIPQGEDVHLGGNEWSISFEQLRMVTY
jgi:hypothetical protein